MTEPADSAALWDDLQQLIRDVIEEMNRLEDLRTRTGGLSYQLGETNSIVVTRQSLPSISITISHRRDALKVEASALGGGSKAVEAEETLTIETGESGSTFRNETGEVFTIEETVYYILRLFLHFNSVASRTAARQK